MLGRRPFHILVPAAAVLFALLMVVSRESDSHHAFQPPPDISGVRALFEPTMEQKQLVDRAAAHLREHGIDPTGYFSGVWQHFDRRLLAHLRSVHGDEAVLELARLGAPLVTWSVRYFQPAELAAHHAGMQVVFDRSGQVIGFSRWRHDPNAMRAPVSDEWLAQARRRVARWLGLDPARLVGRNRTAFLGSALAEADAVWEISGLRLGTARVLVTALRRGDTLTFFKQVYDPAVAPGFSQAGITTAYWAAIMVGIAIAFLLGASMRPSEAPAPSSSAPLALATGLVFTAAVCAVQGTALLGSPALFPRVIGIGLLVGAPLALAAALLSWRARRAVVAPGLSRWLRVGLIATVAASYVIMSMSCSLYLDAGCTRVCGLIRYTSAPLVVLALIAGGKDSRFHAFAVGLAATALIPHCICDNFLNHFWVARLGSSPMCYFVPFVLTLVAVLGLRGHYPRLCLAGAGGASIGVALVGLGHQLYGFPW